MTILVLSVFMLAFFIWYSCRLKRSLKRERLRHAGARWLADYNYAVMAATQDWAVKRLGLSLADFYDGIRPLLHGRKYIAQMIPIARVPVALVLAAMEFNKATDTLAGTTFDSMWLDVDNSRCLMQLETAVSRLTGKNYEDYVGRVAEEAGLSTAEVQLVLLTYSSMINDEVEHLLGAVQDPEKILPSIY